MPEISDQDYKTFLRLQDVAGKYDGPEGIVKKIGKLEEDNQKYRDKISGLEPKVPADGAVVLAGDDAARWKAAEKLLPAKPEEIAGAVVLTGDGAAKWKVVEAVDVADLTARAEKADGLEAKLADLTRRDSIAAAVEALKWPKETVATLHDMRSLDGATWEVKTEKVRGPDGKEVEAAVPYVTLPGEGMKPERLAEFASKTDSLKGLRTTAGEKEKPGILYRPDPALESGRTGPRTEDDHRQSVRERVPYNI